MLKLFTPHVNITSYLHQEQYFIKCNFWGVDYIWFKYSLVKPSFFYKTVI